MMADCEYTVLKERILDRLPPLGDAAAALALADSVKPDGTFPTVDYEWSCPITWPPIQHLSHLHAMAWHLTRGSLSPDERVRLEAAALGALDHWLDRNYQCMNNWFFNEILGPRLVGQICLLLESRGLSAARRRRCLTVVRRAERNMDKDTGANLLDRAMISLAGGLLARDQRTIEHAVAMMISGIRIREGEGVQSDYSFHQHEAVLYNHGYGTTFLSEAIALANLVRGTRFALAADVIDVLSRLVLDGVQWMSRLNACDMGAAGRGISRPSHAKSYDTSALAPWVRVLIDLDPVRAPTLRGMLMRFQGNNAVPLIGNRYFWRSDYLAHHRADFFFSVRMCSDRLFRTDWACNGEGLLSHHIADGCTFLMRRGGEYRNIFPLWDWQRVPGTTVRTRARPSGEMHTRGGSPFAGGVSDGQFGCAAFDLVHGSLRARKAWFCFDDEIVCLGAGIRARSPGAVVTTLDQCWLRGPVRVGRGKAREVLKPGARDLEGVRWVHHDGVTYAFPDPVRVHLVNEERTGSWYSINRAGSREPVSGRVFQLSLDHGALPKGAGYAYSILMGSGRKTSHASILANEPDLQAVRHKLLGMTGVAFYAAGELAADGFGRVTADQPCLLLLREVCGGLEVTASSPVIGGECLEVCLMGLPGIEATRLCFDLPRGLYAGSSLAKRVMYERTE